MISRAQVGDANELALLAEETFRETFAALNTREDMDLHCRTYFGEALQSAEIRNPDLVTLLARDTVGLIGFAQLRFGHVPPCIRGANPGEVQRLYVATRWHGKGAAQALMHACIEILRERHSDQMWLGVWERNPKAIAFYRKLGFIEVGDHQFLLGRDPQRDIIMAREP